MKKRIIGVSLILLLLAVILNLRLYPSKVVAIEKTKPIDIGDLPVEEVYVSKINEYREEYSNNDIVAELVIDDLGIDSLITKSTNNEYYLNHNLTGNDDVLGNPYIDFRNELPLGLERQINIYSHNSDYYSYQEQLPFYKLENYLDEEKFDNSKNVYLYTEEEILEYEVYALKIITTDNEHTVLDSKSDARWDKHLEKLLTDTKYCKDDCKLDSTDKLLILQTCNFQPRDSYILIILKRV